MVKKYILNKWISILSIIVYLCSMFCVVYYTSHDASTYEYNPDENELILTITNKDREGGNVFDLDVKKYVKKLADKY